MLSNQWNDSRLHNYIRLQVEWTIHKTKFEREGVGGGVAGKGSTWLRKGRMIMYSTRLVGALVMTSSTIFGLWSPTFQTHDGPFSPMRVQVFYTDRLESVHLSLFLHHLFSSRPFPQPITLLSPRPPQPQPTTSRHGLWSHIGIVSDLNETGPASAVSCGFV